MECRLQDGLQEVNEWLEIPALVQIRDRHPLRDHDHTEHVRAGVQPPETGVVTPGGTELKRGVGPAEALHELAVLVPADQPAERGLTDLSGGVVKHVQLIAKTFEDHGALIVRRIHS